MINRKDAVLMAVAGLLASAGLVKADATEMKNASLSLAPVITADEVAPAPAYDGLLMQGLDKAGAAKSVSDYGLNIYGWVEGGYTYTHRQRSGPFADNGVGGNGDRLFKIAPGPFNHEYGNHFMLNQLVIRLEKGVASDKWDVGGMIELMYGSDAARIHSSGMGFNGSDLTDNNIPNDPQAVANVHPIWQFDVTQAYLDVNVPVGNGLKIRAGKFVTLLGYETIDPRGNAFYSHSFIFSAMPFTQTGVLASYTLNDNWSFIGGFTRGWDQTLEDGGPDGGVCAIDGLGQIAYKMNEQLSVLVNWSIGPQNFGDSSHYRTAIDPIVVWQATKELKFAAEGYYLYDGGINGDALAGVSHAYGDVWGLALYASYFVNDYVTINGRAEKCHSMLGSFAGLDTSSLSVASAVPTLNVYEFTLGVTVTPFPKDPLGKNLMIRPEVRYDWCEDPVFVSGRQGNSNFKDQLTFGADIIFKF